MSQTNTKAKLKLKSKRRIYTNYFLIKKQIKICAIVWFCFKYIYIFESKISSELILDNFCTAFLKNISDLKYGYIVSCISADLVKTSYKNIISMRTKISITSSICNSKVYDCSLHYFFKSNFFSITIFNTNAETFHARNL